MAQIGTMYIHTLAGDVTPQMHPIDKCKISGEEVCLVSQTLVNPFIILVLPTAQTHPIDKCKISGEEMCLASQNLVNPFIVLVLPTVQMHPVGKQNQWGVSVSGFSNSYQPFRHPHLALSHSLALSLSLG